MSLVPERIEIEAARVQAPLYRFKDYAHSFIMLKGSLSPDSKPNLVEIRGVYISRTCYPDECINSGIWYKDKQYTLKKSYKRPLFKLIFCN